MKLKIYTLLMFIKHIHLDTFGYQFLIRFKHILITL